MDLKKIAFSEQFSHALSSKRKVVSGFGLGAGVSLLVITVIFLYCPFKFNPMFQGFGGFSSNSSSSSLSSWSFKLPQVLSTSSELKRDKQEKTNFDGSKNGTFNGGEVVKSNTHDGNFTDRSQNASFFSSSGNGGGGGEKTLDGNSKNGTFNGGEVEKSNTHDGNFTDRSQSASFFSSSGNGGEKTLDGNSKNGTLSSKGVQTHPGNLSGEARNGSISSKEEVGANNGGLNGTASVDGKSSRSPPSSEEKKIEDTHGGNSSEIVQETNGGNSGMPKGVDYRSEKCDIYKGRWVRDEGKPLYPSGSCPLIDKDFDCVLNGRPDTDFLKWRWQPDECDLPSLNATDFLERLRGKRLIYVGDSLNRNMWESLVCILRHSVTNKSSVHEISGRSHFKERVQGFYSFRYDEYNCSVDFVSAPFLVSESSAKGVNGSMPTLRLDLMDHTIAAYRGADVVVFNTGHWWTHEKTSKGENYYQEGNHVYPKLNVLEAYNKALTTWAKWVDKHIDTNRTLVFFRGYSVTHFRGGQWNSGGQCHKETEPIFNQTFLAKYPSKMKAVERVIHKMKTPVVYMNISRLTDFRKDGHPSIYRMEYKTEEERTAAVTSQDCSHWCLPGVPDTWNELFYASLLKVGKGSWKT